jgi:hypothetical protein|tara:strand:- start:358 stop:657 length:300 start_codon:yes stop_codon:yes gene_type:complete
MARYQAATVGPLWAEAELIMESWAKKLAESLNPRLLMSIQRVDGGYECTISTDIRRQPMNEAHRKIASTASSYVGDSLENALTGAISAYIDVVNNETRQ